MRSIGFSTGAIAKGDFVRALHCLLTSEARTVELSALRLSELGALRSAYLSLDLQRFDSVSVHLPSEYDPMDEPLIIDAAKFFVKHEARVVMHPDAIVNFDAWSELGASLLIENMDKRKRGGRTAAELSDVFKRLPKARLCFDVGHARQVDPSLVETFRIIREFGNRIELLHVSEVTSSSRHEALSVSGLHSLSRVSKLLPLHVAVVIEAALDTTLLSEELTNVNHALSA